MSQLTTEHVRVSWRDIAFEEKFATALLIVLTAGSVVSTVFVWFVLPWGWDLWIVYPGSVAGTVVSAVLARYFYVTGLEDARVRKSKA